ncbi:MAG: cation:proton antiporter [Alphaproteobacteria bacterium]
MEISQFAIVAALLLAFALVSRRLENTIITPPMVFVVAGFLLGGDGLGLLDLDVGEEAIHLITELTLVLVLFADASRIDLGQLRKQHNLPVRMLSIGLPLTILLGTVMAMLVFPELDLWAAALLAAVLAPTDAALGQAVVTRADVPSRIRQTINVESGLNDGIALPVVIFFICLNSTAHDLADVDWLTFAAQQIGIGSLAGITVGYAGGKAIDLAWKRAWMTTAFQGISALGVALLAYACASMLGGNGFIAAFAAGLVVGAVTRHACGFLFEFAEAEGQLLTLFTFLVLGAALVPEAFAHLTWDIVIYAVLSLTFIRMVPIALSLAGSGLKPPSYFFLGWFGPRGLASVLFALLVLSDQTIAVAHQIMMVTIVTVVLSITLHGMSAVPFSKIYAGYLERKRQDVVHVEDRDVSQMPLRISRKSKPVRTTE